VKNFVEVLPTICPDGLNGDPEMELSCPLDEVLRP
jgi:hypothetical protein